MKATAAELETFVARHGHEVSNALDNQCARMHEAAAEAAGVYAAIKDDPEARAKADASLMTTEGWRQSAARFTQAADQAAAAALAWDELTYSEDRPW